MNRIDRQIKRLSQSKKIGLMTHVVVGYPTLQDTEKIIEALVKGGSDFIELQIPFSDPMADGPVIMQANTVALKQNVHIENALSVMGRVTKKYQIPFLFMGYFNSIFNYGVEKFCKDTKRNGASGLIIPDIPKEEEKHEQFIHNCLKYDLYPIRVLSPASTKKRIIINALKAKGFIYLVRGYGVTGNSLKSDGNLNKFIKNVRKASKLPLAMGFGISTPAEIRDLNNLADIVVVGSAVIGLVIKQRKNLDFRPIERYVRSLKEEC